jgi:hypothetical protein
VETLASNPSIPNFGVTGPADSNNDKIFTHSFVHRTHIEVFGHLFPPSFKNWWSDDWITTVYGSEHTFRVPDIIIKHNVGAQKEHGYTRYSVDKVYIYVCVCVYIWIFMHAYIGMYVITCVCAYVYKYVIWIYKQQGWKVSDTCVCTFQGPNTIYIRFIRFTYYLFFCSKYDL